MRAGPDPRGPLLARRRALLEAGGVYSGGNAPLVEASLGLSGAELLYVGDHLFGDVHVTKAMLRWRTGLVLRELEEELVAQVAFRDTERELNRLMAEKAVVDRELGSRPPGPAPTPAAAAAAGALTARTTSRQPRRCRAASTGPAGARRRSTPP